MDETATTSLYLADAGPEAGPAALAGRSRAQVAVIGGGITGLAAALHLAEAGTDVALLEAEVPGWGASGRNGGQVNPGLKFDPSEIVERFGAERGERLVRFAWGAPGRTEALIARLGIDCGYARCGTLRAARTDTDAAAVRRSHQDMIAFGMPVEWLGAQEIARYVGHGQYCGGFLDRRGGALQPLRYVRGLARAAAGAGARLHGGSRVTALSREGPGWRLETSGGVLVADRVLVAANGYADGLVPGLRRALVPVLSSILATPPLPPDLSAQVMPGRQVLYEAGLVTVYCRVDDSGRLIIGGRGPMRPSARIAQMRAIAGHALRLWPGLRGLGWERAWNGRVAITPDHLPHLHEPEPGMFTVYGYNGRGVALAGEMGRVMAEFLAARIGREDLPLPVTRLTSIKFHALWRPAVTATVTWARLKDRWDRGRS